MGVVLLSYPQMNSKTLTDFIKKEKQYQNDLMCSLGLRGKTIHIEHKRRNKTFFVDISTLGSKKLFIQIY